MIALVPVRDGVLPVGSEEAVAAAGGRAFLVGDKVMEAAPQLAVTLHSLRAWEAGSFRPAAWALALAPVLEEEPAVLLPASPDGRDLAPRLAHLLDRPLVAGAAFIGPRRAVVLRHGGQAALEMALQGPVIATLLPGLREIQPTTQDLEQVKIEVLSLEIPEVQDPEVVEVLPPDPATIDLSEATRIVAGGRGVGSAGAFAQLVQVAHALGASPGATRAATDVGWADSRRFIGATGVSVNPRLYMAVGISGAVQHITGLGRPDHIVSVNLDAGCPMMAMADLAIVTDAPALIAELALRLQRKVAPHA